MELVGKYDPKDQTQGQIEFADFYMDNISDTTDLEEDDAFATDVRTLGVMIYKQYFDDFRNVFYTGNLRDTMYVKMGNTYCDVMIPARKYSIKAYREEIWQGKIGGRIKYFKSNTSYASKVNETGGFSGKHKNYIFRGIRGAICEWEGEKGYDVSVIER